MLPLASEHPKPTALEVDVSRVLDWLPAHMQDEGLACDLLLDGCTIAEAITEMRAVLTTWLDFDAWSELVAMEESLQDSEQQLGEISAEAASEECAFGDSWPGSRILIHDMTDSVSRERQRVESFRNLLLEH